MASAASWVKRRSRVVIGEQSSQGADRHTRGRQKTRSAKRKTLDPRRLDSPSQPPDPCTVSAGNVFRAMDIVGVGLNATDTVIPVPHYPLSGSKVEIRSAALLPGGQVATAVVACRRWGMAARYVGKLGDDHAAQLHCSEFHKAGIDARIVTAAGCSSQQSFILVESSGERTVLWKRDPRLTLRPEDLRKEWITDARALLVDGHDTEAAITAATWAREAGIPVIADLDELYPGVDRLIPQIDYLI